MTDEEKQALGKTLAVTSEQIDEAIAAVGDAPADIELHLKGSRSTSNAERMHDAPGGGS